MDAAGAEAARWLPSVGRATCTDASLSEEARKAAFAEITDAITARELTILDLAVALAGALTSPEREAREHATHLLGEVVSRCWPVLREGELHTLADFLASRLRDWPCVGAAAAACSALLARPPRGSSDASASAEGGDGGGGAALREDSAELVLQATADMLRTAQSFRQEERCALLALLLAALRSGWGPLAVRRGVPLLDAFLGAADGEKDPRCLLMAFEAVRALCALHHAPGVDPAPLASLADELADWASAYFPVSFNPPPPPPGSARPPIGRADLAAALEEALGSSPFLAAGVVPLLVEKLSSTYRPAKEDALSALKRCCPAYGPDALAPRVGLLWPALRSEVLAPASAGGVAASAPPGAPAGPGGGGDTNGAAALARSAAACLTMVVRAAGPGAMDSVALQDAHVRDVLSIVESSGSGSSGGGQGAAARTDAQVVCGAMLLAAVCAAGPESLQRAQAAVLQQLQSALLASLGAPDAAPSEPGAAAASGSGEGAAGAYGRPDGTLYGMTVLATVVDGVAEDMAAPGAGAARWMAGGAAGALAQLKATLTTALARLHQLLHPARPAVPGRDPSAATSSSTGMDVDSGGSRQAGAGAALAEDGGGAGGGYAPGAAAQLQLCVVFTWGALLHLHMAAAAAAAAAAEGPGVRAGATASAGAAALCLTQPELAAAAEQLCACALPDAAAEGAALRPSRMHWGRQVDVAQEAATALQQLLRMSAAPPAQQSAQAPAASALGDSTDDVVRLLVRRLVAAMEAGNSSSGSGSSSSSSSGGAAAMRLAAQLAAESLEFGAELLRATSPLLLRPATGDAAWLLECLSTLSGKVLPAVRKHLQDAAAAAPTAAAAAAAAAATSAAAHHLAATALAEPPTASASPGLVPPLQQAWCSVVQQLVACCSEEQQRALAVDAADCIATAGVAAAQGASMASPGAAAQGSSSGGARRLPIACAVLVGLRPGILASRSTQVAVEALLRLLLSAVAASARGGGAADSDAPDATAAAAAAALAAAVNRWQDAAALDAWLESDFRAALVEPLQQSTAVSVPPLAALAVGWVGRGLALRNHAALRSVAQALTGCLLARGAEGSSGGSDRSVQEPGPQAGPLSGAAGAAAEALGVLVADDAHSGGLSLPAQPAAAVCRVLWQQRTFTLCSQLLSEAAASATAAGSAGRGRGRADALPLAVAVSVGCLVRSAPRALSRQNVQSLAPLLLGVARRLCASLPAASRPQRTVRAVGAAASTPASHLPECSTAHQAAMAALALDGVLAVLMDWLHTHAQQKDTQAATNAGKVLEDNVDALMDVVCAASRVGAPPAHAPADAAGSLAVRPPHGSAADAVVRCREEALRCALATMDALPYHLLHPKRQQVQQCLLEALDDGKRSVRQLAVRARRAWGDK